MTLVYQNALAEVDTILKLLSKDLLEKIPNSFLDFIEQKKSKTYVTNLDMKLNSSEQNLMKETKAILSLIYRDYLCDFEQSRKLKIDDEIELRTKYNPNNIFKRNDKIT